MGEIIGAARAGVAATFITGRTQSHNPETPLRALPRAFPLSVRPVIVRGFSPAPFLFTQRRVWKFPMADESPSDRERSSVTVVVTADCGAPAICAPWMWRNYGVDFGEAVT